LEDDSDLDYIDDSGDEIGQTKNNNDAKRKKKKKTFIISGTIDIDVLLGKDPTASVSSSNFSSDDINKSFSKPAAKDMLADEESPWWLESNQSAKENEQEGCEEAISNEEDIATVTEEAQVEEEEEGDWEWEEYDEEEQEPGQEEVEITEGYEFSKQTKISSNDIDVRAPWIANGLENFLALIPKLAERLEDSSNEDEVAQDEVEEDHAGVKTAQNHVEDSQQDYKEWLEQTAELQQSETEILKEDIAICDTSAEVTLTKAQRLVEKIASASGSDLKKILFSLKTFFQTDKNLVYDFVNAQGITKLIELDNKNESGQLQNLILRALGQIMLYVDGMNGVMANPEAIQFLYTLVKSPNSLVCKTAVKLLLVFVEYTESNCLIFIQTISRIDKDLGAIPWSNVIGILKQSSADMELKTFALTLINKTLFGIPDQDTFYDHSDYMEEQNMDSICERLAMDEENVLLLQQIQLYNVALKQEDGEPVTEEDISYLDEDTTENGLRTSLRKKSEVVSSNFHERKSLRYKTKKIVEGETDSTGDIASVSIRDLEAVFLKHGLPTSESGDRLNALTLNGFLDKARSAFIAKLSKGEVLLRPPSQPKQQETFQREGDIRWEEILENFDRPLVICDLDFSDLCNDDDEHICESSTTSGSVGNIPVPPPVPPGLLFERGTIPPPPPPLSSIPMCPPPIPAPPPLGQDGKPKLISKKHKKTVKLFWKEVPNNPLFALQGKTVWDELEKAELDLSMVEYLFENRGKDVMIKENKQLMSMQKEIIVLDHKRSNAINIGLTKLPPIRVIRSAVLKMDVSIMNREGVEKLLTMLPTEEEVSRIQEAQEAQPDIPLGTAEQFLLTLSSINCLEARLRLWAFKMEFEVTEKEVCEPLMDLKMGLESLMRNRTFKCILSVLLEVGNFLNGTQCKGFQLDYLSKIPEVKDTVHKHSLLYHMTYWVLEQYPNCSDMYSEMGPITRCSRTDFEELERTLSRLESECKLAWDYLKIVEKQENGHELELTTKNKMNEFLHDSAERIIVMNTVYKKVMKRFSGFLTWLGMPLHMQNDFKVHHVCKTLSEFSLEYRTTRERVIQTIEKKKVAREKKRLARIAAENDALMAAKAALRDPKERSSKTQQHRKSKEISVDTQLRALLGQDIDITNNGTLRRRKKHHHRDKDQTPGEQEQEERKEKRKSRRHHHRSSLMEGTLPMTEETLRSFTENEMEMELLETLIGVPDEGTIKRNKERRRSIKERKSSHTNHDLKRSRTRDVWAVLEEDINNLVMQ
jgi:hypothetical protein